MVRFNFVFIVVVFGFVYGLVVKDYEFEKYFVDIVIGNCFLVYFNICGVCVEDIC